MKKMRNLLCVVLAVLMLAAMTACSGGTTLPLRTAPRPSTF